MCERLYATTWNKEGKADGNMSFPFLSSPSAKPLVFLSLSKREATKRANGSRSKSHLSRDASPTCDGVPSLRPGWKFDVA
jgi:hypothetical protein